MTATHIYFHDSARRTRDSVTITQRIEIGGHPTNKPSRRLMSLLVELGGRTSNLTDKSIDLTFPDRTSAEKFKRAAQAEGAIFD